MSIRQILTGHVQKAVQCLQSEGFLATGPVPSIVLQPPKQAAHGDLSCTIALALAKSAGKKPRDIALRLQAQLAAADGLLEKVEIAGPGYLNFFVGNDAWRRVLADILEQREQFLRTDGGRGQRVLLEYVSANPTGPLHVAHGRGAVAGDVMANLLAMTGHTVEREYYVNDLGHQIDVMARSIYLRYSESFGRPFAPPEDFYPGQYITDMALEARRRWSDLFVDKAESEWIGPLRQLGIERMRQRIADDLQRFGVRFDSFVSERELTERVGLLATIERLRKAGHVYEEDGKLWFRTTAFGDDKDRVVLREDGRPTYFASDIAYHAEKMSRGFTRLVNVWGADHGGYVTRVKAGLTALGYENDPLTVVLMQMVSLSRGGSVVRMGKRLGTAVWLREIIDEAGRDATRYFFLMRRNEAQMDFDIDLATKRSLDNPVFYAQMGHARLAAIRRKADAAGVPKSHLTDGALNALELPEELDLIKTLARAPEVIEDAARVLEPHLVVHYLQALIGQFHSYYTQYKGTERVISDHAEKTKARLLLCEGLQVVLKVLLDILGVDAPEQMSLDDTSDAVADT